MSCNPCCAQAAKSHHSRRCSMRHPHVCALLQLQLVSGASRSPQLSRARAWWFRAHRRLAWASASLALARRLRAQTFLQAHLCCWINLCPSSGHHPRQLWVARVRAWSFLRKLKRQRSVRLGSCTHLRSAACCVMCTRRRWAALGHAWLLKQISSVLAIARLGQSMRYAASDSVTVLTFSNVLARRSALSPVFRRCIVFMNFYYLAHSVI